MSTWILIVLLIVGVLAAGMMRERWRLVGAQRWVQRRGMQLYSPYTPGERPPMVVLAARFEGREPRRWGAGVEGVLDGVPVSIAEHETAASGADAQGSLNTVGIWRVLVAWPASAGGRNDALAPWTHGGELTRDGEWAGWRMRGTLTPVLLESIANCMAEARRRFE